MSVETMQMEQIEAALEGATESDLWWLHGALRYIGKRKREEFPISVYEGMSSLITQIDPLFGSSGELTEIEAWKVIKTIENQIDRFHQKG